MLLRLLFAICLACHISDATAQPVLYTSAQLQQDLRYLQDTIAAIHPDTGFSADPAALAAALKTVETKLNQPMTRDQAWRVFASLNPVFADGHLQVWMPDWKAQVKAHLNAGGTLFPFETHIDERGELFIRSELGGAPTSLAGRRIESINGIPAREVSVAMLAVATGDTPAFRASQVARRMWLNYLKLFGAPPQFDLVLAMQAGSKRVRVPASRVIPASVAAADDDMAELFQFELMPDRTALLTVNAFSMGDKKLFYAFTRKAFARMREAGVTSLIIDIRQNGGGDDDMWREGIMPYIATKPYRHTSTYIKKVIAGRESDTEKLGEVIRGEQKNWAQPEPDNPLRFDGKVYVLVGRLSYSSAIVFSNVVQDFGIGQLVGEPGIARARQSGGIQNRTLPNTGLGLVIPRFILERPAGAQADSMVHPDIVIPDNPFNRRELVERLRAYLLGAR